MNVLYVKLSGMRNRECGNANTWVYTPEMGAGVDVCGGLFRRKEFKTKKKAWKIVKRKHGQFFAKQIDKFLALFFKGGRHK